MNKIVYIGNGYALIKKGRLADQIMILKLLSYLRYDGMDLSGGIFRLFVVSPESDAKKRLKSAQGKKNARLRVYDYEKTQEGDEKYLVVAGGQAIYEILGSDLKAGDQITPSLIEIIRFFENDEEMTAKARESAEAFRKKTKRESVKLPEELLHPEIKTEPEKTKEETPDADNDVPKPIKERVIPPAHKNDKESEPPVEKESKPSPKEFDPDEFDKVPPRDDYPDLYDKDPDYFPSDDDYDGNDDPFGFLMDEDDLANGFKDDPSGLVNPDNFEPKPAIEVLPDPVYYEDKSKPKEDGTKAKEKAKKQVVDMEAKIRKIIPRGDEVIDMLMSATQSAENIRKMAGVVYQSFNMDELKKTDAA